MTPEDIAETISTAFPTGDVETLRTVFNADGYIWHSYDRRSQTVEENLTLVEAATEGMTGLHYADIRREFFPGGFVQQHRLVGKNREGQVLDAEVCIVVRTVEGQIVRLDEYIDASQLRALGL